MRQISKMKVLIVGMRGLGVETAKNLILTGTNSVTLFDPNPARMCDLGSNFCINEDQVAKGVSRAEASFKKLQELNLNVKVNVINELSNEDL